ALSKRPPGGRRLGQPLFFAALAQRSEDGSLGQPLFSCLLCPSGRREGVRLANRCFLRLWPSGRRERVRSANRCFLARSGPAIRRRLARPTAGGGLTSNEIRAIIAAGHLV